MVTKVVVAAAAAVAAAAGLRVLKIILAETVIVIVDV